MKQPRVASDDLSHSLGGALLMEAAVSKASSAAVGTYCFSKVLLPLPARENYHHFLIRPLQLPADYTGDDFRLHRQSFLLWSSSLPDPAYPTEPHWLNSPIMHLWLDRESKLWDFDFDLRVISVACSILC